MRELMERIRQARDWCIQQGMQLEILPGCEIFYTPQTVRMLRDGLIPTLAESEFVLVEFLPTAPYRELQSAAKALTAAGYMPVFAHIERYGCLRWPGRVRKLKRDFSVCMQMNAHTICRKHSFFFTEMGERRHSKGLCRFCGDGFAQRNQPRMQDEGLLPRIAAAFRRADSRAAVHRESRRDSITQFDHP